MPYEVDREPIWVALLALLQGSLGAKIVTSGRNHVRPPQLMPEQQPALFLLQVREKRDPRPPGTPGKVTLEGIIVLYCQSAEPVVSETGQDVALGATTLNSLFLLVDAALAPDNPMTGKQTLGGLVTHCWIEGNTDMDPGIVTQQAAAIIPVKILVP